MKKTDELQTTTREPAAAPGVESPQRVRIKVRGTATFIREGDELRDFEFAGCQPGEPVKNVLRKQGLHQLYETKNSLVAQLKVDRNAADPAAEMMGGLTALVRDRMKREPAAPRAKRLLEKEHLTVWHRRRDNTVIVQMEIVTDTEQELSAQLFNLTQEVNKCLAINRTSLKPLRR